MGTYRNKELQAVFNISSDTVRAWTGEFGEYLSPLAKPGTGKHRIFSDDDLGVFALISDMRSKSMSYDEIHVSLKNGQRGFVPEIAHERAIELSADLRLSIAQDNVVQLQAQLAEVQQHAQGLHDENIRLKTREEIATGRTKEYEEKIDRLQREIGRLEAQLASAINQDES